MISKSKTLLTAGLLLVGTSGFAQLYVTMPGDVGIGTATPYAKLHIDNNVQSYSVEIDNYSVSMGFKMGLYNYQYEPSSGGSVYGIYNQAITAGGGGWGYSLGIGNYSDGGDGYVEGLSNSAYSYGGSNNGYGINNYAYVGSSGTGYGLYNYLYGANGGGQRYGVYNYVVPGTGLAYGVYSSTSGAANFAGYFDGNVRVNGTLTVMSDERKKQDIKHLEGALGIVSQLNGHTYTFIKDPNFNLPEGQQYGFLAQEIEQVLPTLVTTAVNPNHPDLKDERPSGERKKPSADDKPVLNNEVLEGENVKSVNYIGVIPILVEAIKEQQVIIERQQKQIQALEDKVGN